MNLHSRHFLDSMQDVSYEYDAFCFEFNRAKKRGVHAMVGGWMIVIQLLFPQ